jgi:hypothetical protein
MAFCDIMGDVWYLWAFVFSMKQHFKRKKTPGAIANLIHTKITQSSGALQFLASFNSTFHDDATTVATQSDKSCPISQVTFNKLKTYLYRT